MTRNLVIALIVALCVFAQERPEMVLYPNTPDGTGTDDQTAGEVSFTPSGNIEAVTVKAAIEELDTEKLATGATAAKATALAANGGNCTAGNYPLGVDASGAVEDCTAVGVGTDDQTAAEVSFTPSGNIEGATVKAAIEELDSEKLATGATAAAASALATNPTACVAGKYVSDIDADGTLTCVTDNTGTDDQTAAEVSVTPAGNIASTNAGDAFNELDTEKLVAIPAVNAQEGTSYALVAADNGKVVTLSNAEAITLTVPADLGAGFNCLIVQLAAGQVTPTASGTTINQRLGYTKTAGQYAVATLVAYAANTFVLSGDLE